MATRTNEANVQAIIQTSLPAEAIQRFIADANLWVTTNIASLSNPPDSSTLEQIERWLAAALMRVREIGIAEATIKDVREKYQVDPQVSDYLLTAASLDTTGTVRAHFLAAKPEPERAAFVPIARVIPGFTSDAESSS